MDRYQAKNLIEYKHARRLLLEGRVIEAAWRDAADRFAFVLKPETELDRPWTLREAETFIHGTRLPATVPTEIVPDELSR